MKTKLAFAIGVLFAVAPLAAPKGQTQGLSFSASCSSLDTCTVTGSGLAASTSYVLMVADSCNGQVLSSSVNTNGSGVLNLILNGVAESSGCNVTGWTFTLSTGGRRSSVVASFFAADPD